MGLRGSGPKRGAPEFSSCAHDAGHANEPDHDAETGGEPKRHADHYSAPGHGGESPEERADQGIASSEIEASLRKGNANERRMFYRQKNAGDDRDPRKKKKPRSKAIAEKEERAEGGND